MISTESLHEKRPTGIIQKQNMPDTSVLQLVTATQMAPRMEGCVTATQTLPSEWWGVSAVARPMWKGHAATNARPATTA